MDTILNLGLNDKSVLGLAHSTNNERFAYDSYRRFIQMFSDIVDGIPKSFFDKSLEKFKEKQSVKSDNELSTDSLKGLIKEYKEIYKNETGEDFPQEPIDQLFKAISAVFKSWNNSRAIVYRNVNKIPHDLGTAVNIQSMVFGNMGPTSGTGVAFSRNPSTGENALFGEFLLDAQGEDVVAGIRTPEPISNLKNLLPDVYKEFFETAHKLEKHYKDMQDLEFTIENGKLFLLQTRNGKRTAQAAINVVVDFVNEGLLTKEEAILKVNPESLNQLLHPTFDDKELKSKTPIAKGLSASPGAASGKIYFHSKDVAEKAKANEKVILVRQETSPEDIEGMISAEGILTARGGMTSHAAVVARGMGKCCVAGASDIKVDEDSNTMKIGDKIYHEGDVISINGNTGLVYEGVIKKVNPSLSGNFATFMTWVDEVRELKVRTNADTPRDAKQALEFGAEGIGLCRTEHMFFDEKRIPSVRKMILSKTIEKRNEALEEIRPMQEKDFYDIYLLRSEERRVGKECRSRWSPYH